MHAKALPAARWSGFRIAEAEPLRGESARWSQSARVVSFSARPGRRAPRDQRWPPPLLPGLSTASELEIPPGCPSCTLLSRCLLQRCWDSGRRARTAGHRHDDLIASAPRPFPKPERTVPSGGVSPPAPAPPFLSVSGTRARLPEGLRTGATRTEGLRARVCRSPSARPAQAAGPAARRRVPPPPPALPSDP